MAGKLKVTIDREGCISCASCWTICPEVFEESADDGLCRIVEQYRSGGDKARGEAPEDLGEKVREAADSCPTSVIHL